MLRKSEQYWRSLTEALPQLVWTATPDGLDLWAAIDLVVGARMPAD